ncbi:MAG TPA: peroxide stress protein YaaA [Gaiellaceae bacterium]|jgi:cytoplasmic iron level regulating protein YaaA (DUF328/UPF0246 family)|nr:peroxide stress protein YaaA [Gaiellaceae bacterium]
MAARRPPLILLPPSETKWAPTRGKPIELASLSFPSLNALRESLLDCDLRAVPTATAGRLYTGVLYAALDIAGLPRGAARELVIISAQYGALRAADRVAPYRRELEAGYWRDALREPLHEAAAGRVILDCRSATYATAWRPSGEAAGRWVHVNVVEEREGVRHVVSHMAKKVRGEVARHVLVTGARPRNPAELAEAVAQCFRCELEPPRRSGGPFELTIVKRMQNFVPAGFRPPAGLTTADFRLEPLGPEHNERDQAAWMSSIDHINATPGWSDGPWPFEMTARSNLADLEMHARHFREGRGFTYTVLEPATEDVIGCVYIYPDGTRSWVRASHAELDAPLREAVAAWLATDTWPFENG